MNKFNMKKIALTLIILTIPISAQQRAQGLFLAAGLGPDLAMGEFAGKSVWGYGFDIEISYTDNVYLPFFLFGSLGYTFFPGDQELYNASEYNHFSVSYIPISGGARMYMAPFTEGLPIMPVAEISASLLLYSELHQYKISAARPNETIDGTAFGFSAGFGASMFVLEVMLSYNYYQTNQFMSLDFRARIPLFITI